MKGALDKLLADLRAARMLAQEMVAIDARIRRAPLPQLPASRTYTFADFHRAPARIQ